MSSDKKRNKAFSTNISFYKLPKENSFKNIQLLIPLYKSSISDNNKIRTKILNLNQTLKPGNYSENDYINRPITTFTPKMPLFNFEKKELINPSKLNYVVSINPPPCHRVHRGFRSMSKRNSKSNLNFSFLRPDSQNEIDEFEKGLFTSFRKERFSKRKNNLF